MIGKRHHLRFLLLATAAALFLHAATASATPPQLLSVTSQDRHVTATWSSPPGITQTELRISTENKPSDDFGLEGPGYGFMAPVSFPDSATSFTTPAPLDVGTYYVRVGGNDPNDGNPSQVWSNVLQVNVRPIAVPASARTYKGKTKQREGIRVVATNREVFRVTLTVTCHGYTTGDHRRVEGPVPIAGKRFTMREQHVGGGGSESIIVKGKFEGKGKVSGKIIFAIEDSYRGVNCVARVPFSGRRVNTQH